MVMMISPAFGVQGFPNGGPRAVPENDIRVRTRGKAVFEIFLVGVFFLGSAFIWCFFLGVWVLLRAQDQLYNALVFFKQ